MRAPKTESRSPALTSEEGFSLVEILIVVAIIGIIVNIAIPVMMDAQSKGDAAKVLADAELVHDALLRYRMENGSYPPNSGWGVVPPALVPYLPPSFAFTYKDLRYRYRLTRQAKRFDVDGGGRRSLGRRVIPHIRDMYQGQSTGNQRRAFLWLPSPGGQNS